MNKLAKLETKMAEQHSTPLSKNTQNMVFGVGDPNANLMLIGEAPGEQEDKVGEPFVGRAGKFLDALLNRAGIQREEAYITNTVKYRPPRNRTPTDREANRAKPYLDAQITLVDPNAIVAIGQFASRRLTNMEASLQYLRGEWWPLELDQTTYPVRPVYHPGFLLRQNDRSDMKRLCQMVIEELQKTQAVAEEKNKATFQDERTREVDTGAALQGIDTSEIEFE